ncbi:putative O-methyltransferase YrrM [Oikeobacillus pervagus]|uniref:tRNA 5-hydroxyuridine methyltransferase n=1 Tax=Oikeobacillus pervagus TaxID=1325931 RepID=A0AAJ1WIP7_9BACI|nr:O-methyltransferase [Oikeobacillus pervagus]MDQ0214623.1 putative O-methyltransferase YrrM [Oikeobacillus pervagus]
MNDELHHYIDSLLPGRDSFITDMEKFAKDNGVPIMETVGIEALLQFLRIQQPNNILEIGTAIGYSSLRMAKALPKANIVTIERDEIRYTQAIQYIEQAGYSDRIQLIFGDALETVHQVGQLGPFDAIFIDAAKGQYTKFFELYTDFLRPNGVVYTDNVLFKGLVTKELIEKKRIRSLVRKIQTYNEWLMNHSTFHTTILPVGDGLAVSIKRGE